jgi:hypothetical protein
MFCHACLAMRGLLFLFALVASKMSCEESTNVIVHEVDEANKLEQGYT